MDYKNGYNVNKNSTIGAIKIADEVIMGIAAITAKEVKGVARLSGNNIYKKIRGVKVAVDETVKVELTMELDYGVSIPVVSEKVQDKVKTAIENMTGLKVSEVNVRIAGVAIDEE
ncbi:MAG: Asp23/Gls24 family envelope stress response protein [Lachnospiraceae bacterium]|nr:Asp23/Gls24 family envelope stress response protein [Lachnospiraceae bacterium]